MGNQLLETMIKYLVFLVIFLTTSCVTGCPTKIEGWTFQFDAEVDTVITGIDNYEMCEQECLNNSSCAAFTYEENEPLDLCLMFVQLTPLMKCFGCTTSTITRVVTGTSCQNAPDDLVDVIETSSVEECLSFCQSVDSCNHFVWMNQENFQSEYCFLYSSECGESYECGSSCQSGSLNCLYAPDSSTTVAPSTATTSTTTALPPLPKECTNYLILDDATRNVQYGNVWYGDVDYDCSGGGYHTSPDWQNGNKWYRMLPPAGVVIPETSLRVDHCGTVYPGWIRSSHPTEVGQQAEVEVCFSADYDGNGNDCLDHQNIVVTNCGGYYVYLLPEAPGCQSRYCAANNL